MKSVFCIALLCLLSSLTWAQSRDILKLDYVHIGSGNTELDSKIAFTKYGAELTIPQKLKSKDYIFHTLNYSNLNVSYNQDPINFTSSELEEFNSFSYRFTYLNIRENRLPYIISFSPTLSSNFEGSVQLKDIQFYGLFAFMKRYPSGSMLHFGAMYSSSLGFPSPLPYVSYKMKWGGKWQANFGFPKLGVKCQISPKNELGAGLALTGENMRLGKNLDVTNAGGVQNKVVPIDNVRMQNIGGVLDWVHQLNDYSKIKIGAGYTFRRRYGFYDGNKKMREFKLNNNIFLRATLTFGYYKKSVK
ncbi:hypothetical protein EMN47_05775 [Prolixibacteraceae bacterium JC049]|nr:hypothetical protein [Prolixibacteraceae bacterium JC049]